MIFLANSENDSEIFNESLEKKRLELESYNKAYDSLVGTRCLIDDLHQPRQDKMNPFSL